VKVEGRDFKIFFGKKHIPYKSLKQSPEKVRLRKMEIDDGMSDKLSWSSSKVHCEGRE
jgi:hypothetical protein